MKSLQTGHYRFLESFTEHLQSNDVDTTAVKVMVRKALEYFPELHSETITVAGTHEDLTYHEEPHGMADPYNRIIYLNSRSATEYQTLFHELAHILIAYENERGADHPATSEPYCSIIAVSRMPPDMVYRDDIAYLGTPSVPNEKYPEICTRALEYRENHRNYIQKCKDWLEINE